MKRTKILWITALVLGWCFDFLFWGQKQGINFALYVVLCLVGGFLVLARNGIRPAWRSLLLLLPILFFATITFIRQEPLTLFLSFAFALGLMGVLAISFLGGRWPWYGFLDYVFNYAKLIGSMVARPLIFLSESRKTAAADGRAEESTDNSRAGRKRFWAILRGVLIALPVVVVFTALLSSADLVFAQRLHGLTNLFRLENLPEYLFRAFYILVGAYVLAGTLLHAAQKSSDEKLLSEKPLVPHFLGFTEAAVVLGAVVALFAAFVIIQFHYFFGGGANIGVQGYTYSEYARRGFGELVAVALCTLLLFLGLSAIVKRQNRAQRQAFSGLGIGMVALVGVILVSAFQRLLLYETAYGFSRLRMYTHIFMIWLGVLLAAVVALELLRRERLFPLAALLASIGFAATLSLVNVDGSIVRLNVARASAGEPMDVANLASLSSDSIPALVQTFQAASLPASTREAAGAALACWAYKNPDLPSADWRSFNLTGFQAEAALRGAQASLKQYKLQADDWPVAVRSPGGNDFNCFSLY
ncbi:MAG: DUF4173 domain-containing protein [Anaerolineales bacterium]